MAAGYMKTSKTHWNKKYTYALWAVLILLSHCALFLFLSYWNKNIHLGLLNARVHTFSVTYLPLMVIFNLYDFLYADDDEGRLHELEYKKESGYSICLLIIPAIFFIYFIIEKIILTNPYLYGNYISIFVLLALFITYACECSMRYYSGSQLFLYSVSIIITDILSIWGFVMFLMITQPMTLKQALEQTEKAGYEQPVFIGHGEWMDFNSHFMKIDIDTLQSSDINIYNNNLMYMNQETLEPGEEAMGYYFFAAQSGAHIYGIAVSERSGRVVEVRIIKNPIPLTISHSSGER